MQRETDNRTFQEIWNDLSQEQKREMVKAFIVADIAWDRHMLWRWGTGVAPKQPVVRKAIANTMNDKLGFHVTAETLFP